MEGDNRSGGVLWVWWSLGVGGGGLGSARTGCQERRGKGEVEVETGGAEREAVHRLGGEDGD